MLKSGKKSEKERKVSQCRRRWGGEHVGRAEQEAHLPDARLRDEHRCPGLLQVLTMSHGGARLQCSDACCSCWPKAAAHLLAGRRSARAFQHLQDPQSLAEIEMTRTGQYKYLVCCLLCFPAACHCRHCRHPRTILMLCLTWPGMAAVWRLQPATRMSRATFHILLTRSI